MHRVRGIIIKKTNALEHGEHITLYSLEFGKIILNSRGARKITAKLTPSLQLFNLIDAEFVSGKSMHIVTSTYTVDSFQGLKGNLVKLRIIYDTFRFLDSVIIESQQDIVLWDFISRFLDDIQSNGIGIGDINKLTYYAKLHILRILGFLGATSSFSLDKNAASLPKEESPRGINDIFSLDFRTMLEKPIQEEAMKKHVMLLDSFTKGIY